MRLASLLGRGPSSSAPADGSPGRSRRRRPLVLGFGAATLALFVSCYVIYGGGRHEGPGTVGQAAVAPALVADRATRQQAAVAELAHDGRARPNAHQILFGDLHVHTTYSVDAFMMSLPIVGGEGAHPPADACDYARHCSALDFFSLNDHAEGLTPQHWRESVDAIRQCNAVAGDPQSPDLVAYVGWEWTQVGRTPEEHYGHKNVIFRDLEEERLPARPIAAPGVASAMRRSTSGGLLQSLATPIREFSRRHRYLDYAVMMREIQGVPSCPEGVDTRELPADCREFANTPAELFEKLDQWGHASMVIPHGTTWGLYTPPGYTYDKQIAAAQHDPERQRLIEVYSGHGNSEEYRAFRSIDVRTNYEPRCPEPEGGYEPCCWRAGEIVRARCGNVSEKICQHRVDEAQRAYILAGMSGFLTVPDTTPADWLDCDSCPDCFNGSMGYRPGGSVQYILARGNFDERDAPSYAPMGFIASSDNHSARPGTGYKERDRLRTSEARGFRDPVDEARIVGNNERALPPVRAGSRRIREDSLAKLPPLVVANFERQASFFMTGGLVAVHAEGRDREAIWDALARREVYGTSGERILLWFDIINAPGGDGVAPMGAEVELSSNPRFVVRAAGAFEQQPGCPPDTVAAIGQERLDRLCGGECYNPGDARRRITRVEVVRIQPQQRDQERVERLIKDPWKTLECPDDPSGCVVEFADPRFTSDGRDTYYYVRAIQEPTPAINAGGARCERDERGQCVATNLCNGSYLTPEDDDCLTDNEERAWSSPIFVRPSAEVRERARASGSKSAPAGTTPTDAPLSASSTAAGEGSASGDTTRTPTPLSKPDETSAKRPSKPDSKGSSTKSPG